MDEPCSCDRTHLTDLQYNVVLEKRDLDSRIRKLDAFLDAKNSLGDEDLVLLRAQLPAMRAYSEILGSRIERFKKKG